MWILQNCQEHLFYRIPLDGCFCSENYLLNILEYPTNTSRVFHVETTWKRLFPRRFNVENTWCVCRVLSILSRWLFSKCWFIKDVVNSFLKKCWTLSHFEQKMKFPLRISPVNVTKSTVSCGFGHIYWRNF